MDATDHLSPLGKKLRELHEREGLPIREAARRLGISHSRLADFERGHSWGTTRPAIPSRETLRLAAEAYGFPEGTLLALAGLPAAEPAAVVPPSEVEAGAQEVAEVFRQLPDAHRSVLLAVARTLRREVRR